MNSLKWVSLLGAVSFVIAGLPNSVVAFHSGGVGECTGCHSMHSPAAAGSFLLLGIDQSSTCLICHERAGDVGPTTYHISTALADMPPGTPPKQRTPGGDFGWLKKTYTFTVEGAAIVEDGSTHGHNIVAADKGYLADPVNTTSPGGTFSSAQLGCESCHDPHGRYRRLSTGVISLTGAPIIDSGSYAVGTVPGYAEPPPGGNSLGVYRLLGGAGYTKGGTTYIGVPAAKVPNEYNRSESSTQTRTAYGHSVSGGHIGWGIWCATCHPDMHTSSGRTVHPVDEPLGSVVKNIYDMYVKTGDMTGTNATAFNSLVPFIENTGDYVTLASHAKNDDTYLIGPSVTDLVSCLSCHRAHASGWEHALRWNMGGAFITFNGVYPGIDTTPALPQLARGRTSAETQAAYYDRPVTRFATFQRVLCNKCHAMD